MKTFLAVILSLLCFKAEAQFGDFGNVVFMGSIASTPEAPVGPGATNLTADLWASFEFTAAAGAITVSQLTNDCHYGAEAPLNPNVNDAASILSTSTSGQVTPTDKPQGVTDTGTRGLAININSTSLANVQYGLQQSNVMFFAGFIKTATLSSGNDAYLWEVIDGGGNASCLIRERNNAGQHQLLVFPGNGDFGTYNITAGGTYWVMIYYTKGGTCKCGVKNTDGTWLGSSGSGSGPDNTFSTVDTLNRVAQYMRIGRTGGTVSADAVTIYFDNWIVNWGEGGGAASVTYPVGP